MVKTIVFAILTSSLATSAISTNRALSDRSAFNQRKDTTIRAVQYDEFDFGKDDYKNTNYEETSFGFILSAVKTFDSSLFSDIDFVSESSGEEVNVTYEARYYESEGRVTLDVYKLDESVKTSLLDTIEGLVTFNDNREADVIFAEGKKTIFLSQLMKESALDNVNWWNSFCNWITGTINKIKDVIVSGLRLLTHIAVKIVGLDGAASLLDMTKDSNGIYHANFDCWQQYGGYNDFYDFVFNLGSKMSRTKNDFYDQDGDGVTDYILWGWKGDYWELGYGGELGIYKRLGTSELWYVDKKLAIDTTLKIDYRVSTASPWENIVDWDPAKVKGYSAKQWWITGFNPKYAKKKLSDSNLLRAIYTVKFVTKGYDESFDSALKNSFKEKFVDSLHKWTFDSSSSLFSFSFER